MDVVVQDAVPAQEPLWGGLGFYTPPGAEAEHDEHPGVLLRSDRLL